MQKNLNLFVGLFVALGLLALLFLSLRVSNLTSFGSGSRYTVTAAFDEIGGLKQGAAIRSAGVLVGRVGSIDLDRDRFQAVVSLELDPSFQFPADTSAQILTAGLLGEKYVGLKPGADPDNLQQGSKILITQSAVVLESLISQFLYNRNDSGSTDAKSGAGRK